MKKTFLAFLLMGVAFLVVSCSSPNPPTGGEDKEETVKIVVNGEKRATQKDPLTVDGVILLSMDDISDYLGIDFLYDEKSHRIFAEDGDYNIELVLNYTNAASARRSFTLDVEPREVGGVIMIPVEFVATQLGHSVSFDEESNTLKINKLTLTRDEPKIEQHRWAIARARQLSDFSFTPVEDIPNFTKDYIANSKKKGVYKAGVEYNGIPYSSTEYNDKFITENVSFETFLSALANPDSVIYTKNLYNASNASTYYGMVCNTLVRYCLGIEFRCNTANWYKIPGMTKVAEAGRYTVDDIELCDVLHIYNSSSNHVAIITGILRDESGSIVQIEVTDQVNATTRRRINTLEDFEAWRTKYSLGRYENIEAIPEFDEEENDILYNSGIEKTSPKIAVDYGNKSNYFYGETTVISSFAEGENTVQIYRGEELIEEISVNGYTKSERILDGGYYTVRLKDTEYFTEFCVVKPEISHTVENGVITITANPGDEESEIIHMEFRSAGTVIAGLSAMIELTEEECRTGVFSRKIPASSFTYKISFRNRYGIWTHKIISIF